MANNDFYEDDEPVEDVRAAFEAGEKGITRRPRLDSVHSIRFTPEQIDKIRTHIGDDGSVSSFVRDAAMAAIYPPQPVLTYRCGHMTMSGAFSEPPVCRNGCGAMHVWPLPHETMTASVTFTMTYTAA